ncbi:UDP-glucose 4-epimerase GalE [Enterobacter hormaechei]|uniref:UDP-glucose 4-epimerase GalE n=1 Tax=Enterobacter hormaechei TaxID=158836 RepID=UPI003D6FAAA6
MNILLTGGAGYIGSHIAVELIHEDYNVFLFDNLSNSKDIVVEKIYQITGKKPFLYKGDLLSFDELQSFFSKYKIYQVIHLGALKSVGESVGEPIKYYLNNITGTLNLVKVMDCFGVRDLIFSSSATVYGNPKSLPLTESSPTGEVQNPYGYTKLMVEHILEDLCRSNSEWNITSLRYFNPVGAHPSGLIGEDPHDIPNNILPYITQVAIGRREQLCIFGDDYDTKDGTGVRDYIHVQDLALGHIAALKRIKKQNKYQVYNLGTGRGYSVLELIHTFEKINRISIPYLITERREGDIAECWSSPALAEQELGWRACKTLDDMLQDAWNFQVKNPNGMK